MYICSPIKGFMNLIQHSETMEVVFRFFLQIEPQKNCLSVTSLFLWAPGSICFIEGYLIKITIRFLAPGGLALCQMLFLFKTSFSSSLPPFFPIWTNVNILSEHKMNREYFKWLNSDCSIEWEEIYSS